MRVLAPVLGVIAATVSIVATYVKWKADKMRQRRRGE